MAFATSKKNKYNHNVNRRSIGGGSGRGGQSGNSALAGLDAENVKIGFTVNPNNPNKPGPVLISPVDPKDSDKDFKYLLQPNLLVS